MELEKLTVILIERGGVSNINFKFPSHKTQQFSTILILQNCNWWVLEAEWIFRSEQTE